MKSAALAAAALTILAASAGAAPAGKKTGWPAGDLRRGLAALDVSRADWNEIPSRWPASMAVPEVESMLADPLEIPDRSGAWLAGLDQASGLSAALNTARWILSVSSVAASTRGAPGASEEAIRQDLSEKLPPRLARPLGRICGAVSVAQVLVAQAGRSLSGSDRAAALGFFSAILTNRPAARPRAAYYKAAAKFDRAEMFAAASIISAAVEREIPVLRREAGRMKGFPRTRLKFPGGALIVSGLDLDQYGPEDLSTANVIVDFGNGDVYRGPAAAAGPGRIRVVIDLGENAVVKSSGPAAGSGILGVGMMFLPGSGRKTISAGNFSAGAGLFGVGTLQAGGGPLRIKTGSFSQGAGAFGAGIFLARGSSASLSADFAAEGFGFTAGAGLFRLQGNGARLSCGFADPDGHEDKAFLSLCQGVGYGPRAFAAGGVGLAVLEGSGSHVEASYNSQGSGYWHGFGGFMVSGDKNRLLARRYGQGSGIHMAVGSLSIKGNGNSIDNWGVGPGFGWDRGIGNFSVEGDSNTLYAQWASASAQVNGEALVRIAGNRNILDLHDFGFGAAGRDGPSYVLADISGRDNLLEEPWGPQVIRGPAALRFGPWGAAISSGRLLIASGPGLPAPQWPENPQLRARALNRERVALEAALAGSGIARPDALRNCLFVLSAANLDGATAGQAMIRLLSFGPMEASRLPGLLSPKNFDELLWIRLAAQAQGGRLVSADLKALARARGLKKALLLDLLESAPSKSSWNAALAVLRGDPDWRARAQAAATVGYWLDREKGEEMGRLGFLDLAKAVALSTAPLSADESDELGRRTLGDYYALLSLNPAFSLADKMALAFKASNPFDSAGGPAAAEFARQIRVHPRQNARAFQRQIDAALSWEGRGRRALARALLDPSPEVRTAALLALGGMGRSRDAAKISRFLTSRRAAIRVAAAFALGKMGVAAFGEISRLLKSGGRAQKEGAALAAAHSWDPRLFLLLRKALSDPDERVRLAAVSDLSIATYPAMAARRKLLPLLLRLKNDDPAAEVRSAAARAAAQIGG